MAGSIEVACFDCIVYRSRVEKDQSIWPGQSLMCRFTFLVSQSRTCCQFLVCRFTVTVSRGKDFLLVMAPVVALSTLELVKAR